MKKEVRVAILLAVLCGILAGACHAYSVASHRAVGDTFDGVITREVKRLKSLMLMSSLSSQDANKEWLTIRVTENW